MVANPVTLRPLFEADEAMKELGGPAYLAQLTGSRRGADRRARFRRSRSTTSPCCARWSGSAASMVEKRARHVARTSTPMAQIEEAEAALYRVAEEGGGEGKVKSFARGDPLARRDGREGAQLGRRHCRASPPGSTAINAKIGGLHNSDLIILAGRPGMGKTVARHQHRLQRRRSAMLRDSEDGIEPSKSAGAAVAFFSLEMSADQLATRILAEQSRDQLREPAHGQDQPAGFPQPRPRRRRARRACRSTSTTRPA